MDRLFLDANVLFSAAYREGSSLVRLWGRPDSELITSGYALGEAERHLDPVQLNRLAKLMHAVRVVPEPPSRDLPAGVDLPDKDTPILSAAIAAGATHLITGDRRDFGGHFGKTVGGVLVLPPRQYLEPASS